MRCSIRHGPRHARSILWSWPPAGGERPGASRPRVHRHRPIRRHDRSGSPSCAEAGMASGPAERLPLEDACVHYLSWQFAHHHVTDPPCSWSELARVLAPGAGVTLTNIHPPAMPDALLYRFFPDCARRDAIDFPDAESLVRLARDAGLRCETPIITRTTRQVRVADLRSGWSDRRQFFAAGGPSPTPPGAMFSWRWTACWLRLRRQSLRTSPPCSSCTPRSRPQSVAERSQERVPRRG